MPFTQITPEADRHYLSQEAPWFYSRRGVDKKPVETKKEGISRTVSY